MAVVMSPTNTSTPITMPIIAPVDKLVVTGGMEGGTSAITTHNQSIWLHNLLLSQLINYTTIDAMVCNIRDLE